MLHVDRQSERFVPQETKSWAVDVTVALDPKFALGGTVIKPSSPAGCTVMFLRRAQLIQSLVAV